ncbi:MAG: DUF7479 domain-containing protein [Pleomorphochaeta sp.]
MAQWKCSKCNEVMEEVDDIAMVYGDLELPESEGLRCPKCGDEYLLSELVTGELNSSEDMLEGK